MSVERTRDGPDGDGRVNLWCDTAHKIRLFRAISRLGPQAKAAPREEPGMLFFEEGTL